MWCGFPAEQSRYRCCRPDHHDSAHEYRMAGKLVWVADGTPGKVQAGKGRNTTGAKLPVPVPARRDQPALAHAWAT